MVCNFVCAVGSIHEGCELCTIIKKKKRQPNKFYAVDAVNKEHIMVEHANKIKILWKWNRSARREKKNTGSKNTIDRIEIIIIDSN